MQDIASFFKGWIGATALSVHSIYVWWTIKIALTNLSSFKTSNFFATSIKTFLECPHIDLSKNRNYNKKSFNYDPIRSSYLRIQKIVCHLCVCKKTVLNCKWVLLTIEVAVAVWTHKQILLLSCIHSYKQIECLGYTMSIEVILREPEGKEKYFLHLPVVA